MDWIKGISIVNGAYEIVVTCTECGQDQIIKNVDIQKYSAYMNGIGLAQDIGLSPSDTELLITGTCQKCWDKMFPNK